LPANICKRHSQCHHANAYSDAFVHDDLLLVVLIRVKGVQPYVVVHELFPNLMPMSVVPKTFH
jgi:hypothetical protein